MAEFQAIGWMSPLERRLLGSASSGCAPGAVSVCPAAALPGFPHPQPTPSLPAQLFSPSSCLLSEKLLPKVAWEYKRACNRNNKLHRLSWVLPGDAIAESVSSGINSTR